MPQTIPARFPPGVGKIGCPVIPCVFGFISCFKYVGFLTTGNNMRKVMYLLRYTGYDILFRDTKHNVVKSLFDAMDCTGQGGGLKFWRTAIDVSSAGCCLGGTAKRTMRRYTWNLGPGLIAA